MPRSVKKTFQVRWLQILDEEGICDKTLLPPLTDDEVRKFYEWMVLIRVFDQKALILQREGRLGTYAPVWGQWAAKLKKDPAVVLVYFGDGATSKGDFHEGLNIAGVFKVPVVFICQNNQWAISVPLKQQTAAETLAQKAIAYGFEGIQVDGNDVFSVYKATQEALDHARSGGGPTLIECLTYRMGDHTTADDAARYRNPEEVAEWKKKDPIERLKK